MGDVFVKTTYERLTVPVHMKVARGELSMEKLTFTDCFPVSISLRIDNSLRLEIFLL